ncbi:MAG: gliding motility lipoprotein GldH, partial [Flavobacteriales bacterium]|nr:gliding motility lipoprotein GldH [Flavobacteriales bacterium]
MQNKSLIETKNNNKIIAGCLILLGIIGLAGCGSGSAYYEEYIEIPNQQWNQSNVPFFEFEITDTSQRYDMYFNIRHNKAYEWKNIWVFLTFEVPGGQVDRDTLEFVLQDGQSRWLGTSS